MSGTDKAPQIVETLVRLRGGRRVVGAAFPNDFYDPKHKDPKRRDRNLFVDWIEVEGPLDAPPPPPESHARIFAPDPGGTDLALRASKILGPLASRAWRRPVERDELRRLVWLVTEAVEDGAELEEGVRVALQAILVSPHFLFHVVLPKAPDDPRRRVRARPVRARRAAVLLPVEQPPRREAHGGGRRRLDPARPRVPRAPDARRPARGRARRRLRAAVADAPPPPDGVARHRPLPRVHRRGCARTCCARRRCSSRP